MPNIAVPLGTQDSSKLTQLWIQEVNNREMWRGVQNLPLNILGGKVCDDKASPLPLLESPATVRLIACNKVRTP